MLLHIISNYFCLFLAISYYFPLLHTITHNYTLLKTITAKLGTKKGSPRNTRNMQCRQTLEIQKSKSHNRLYRCIYSCMRRAPSSPSMRTECLDVYGLRLSHAFSAHTGNPKTKITQSTPKLPLSMQNRSESIVRN